MNFGDEGSAFIYLFIYLWLEINKSNYPARIDMKDWDR
jgi:hypothetical protein